jgi:atlastin
MPHKSVIFKLEREIEESYGNFKCHNESKNIFKAANTPITLGAVAMMLYMLSQILGIIGLYPFANLVSMS